MRSWLEKNAVEVYSPHNDGKICYYLFIRPLKNKIYKYMTSISKKCVY